ncbi:hypothetical protein [Flavobacterium tyrosinilyticum]|uniref:hypothetical protein n=1 Tax=Flavobacterium tyrosinilyticum TaxID=1658740 RepID=UPI00202F8174|nr:hypothetical protein [Flavobacterium tyrosinilyticum]MCM0665596.1 hypothetical protein [Flavobacterium tyrosinilyticum]
MLKKILYSCLFLSSLNSFSQEIVNSVPIELKKNRDIFQVVNNEKKDVTLFISDKIKVKAIHLDQNMKIVDSISATRPDTKTYDMMIGYNSSNNNPRLFWASNDYEKVIAQLYNISSQKVTTQEYSLALKEEKLLQKFSDTDKFYLLSVIKKSNSLKLHIFDKNGVYSSRVISLDGFHFFKSDYTKSDIYGILGQNLLPFEAPFTIKNINVDNPTSLTDAARKRKCYFNSKTIVITLDTNSDYTQAIIIDLDKFSATERIVRSPGISNVTTSGYKIAVTSNSFYFDNKFYILKSSEDQFFFTVKDLEDNTLKEFTATSNTPIDFKNSEIYQEGGDFGGKRTLTNSSQFLRKIINLNAGLSCYHIGENTLITFGGISSVGQSTGQVTANQFGLIGALVGAAFFSPTMDNFNAYANRKVVKIEGLFDNQDNHIKGDLKPLAFDKIRTFFDEYKDVSSQILFNMDAVYYLGYYDNKTKEYTIRKFVD